MIKRGDIVIIVSVLMCALIMAVSFLFADRGDVSTVVISVDGKTEAQLDLDHDETYTVSNNGHTNVIEISNGRVRMLDADCKDRVCVNQGWISTQGETIVCLPGRVTVTLKNTQQEIDAVAH